MHCEVNARRGPAQPFEGEPESCSPQSCAQPSPPRPKGEGTAEFPTSRAHKPPAGNKTQSPPLPQEGYSNSCQQPDDLKCVTYKEGQGSSLSSSRGWEQHFLRDSVGHQDKELEGGLGEEEKRIQWEQEREAGRRNACCSEEEWLCSPKENICGEQSNEEIGSSHNLCPFFYTKQVNQPVESIMVLGGFCLRKTSKEGGPREKG